VQQYALITSSSIHVSSLTTKETEKHDILKELKTQPVLGKINN
jgi:hypothetical protein